MTQQKKPAKDPLPLRVIRTTFGILDKVLPPVANRWGFKLFITPFRYPLPERERIVKSKSKQFTFEYDGLKLRGYEWGEGPTIVFMHGWAGRGLQVSEMVEPLVNKGFQVVTFDAQAHGASEGKQTNMMLMAGALRTVLDRYDNIHAVIGHSLGGAIALYTMREKHSVQRLVTISTPSVGQGIIDEYLRKINGSPRVGRYLRKRVMELAGQSFDEFTAQTTAKLLPEDFSYLIVHDKNDSEAAIFHAETLMESAPQAKTFFSEGLGHTRILRDKEIIEKVTSFLTADQNVPALSPS